MSTGLNCEYFEAKQGSWYYVLEHYNAPKNAWDWTENADVVGPFGSMDAADKHLHENNANPGGFGETAWRDGRTKEEQAHWDKLVARATRPVRRDTFGGFRFRGGRGW